MSCEILDGNLDAYVDRQLDPAVDRAVREHLNGCSACGRRVGDRQTLARMIGAADYYPAPAALRARVSMQATRSVVRRRVTTWAAAAVLVLAAGAGVSRFGVPSPSAPRAPQEAMLEAVVDGHVRSLMADHLFDVRSTDRHTVKPWFLGRLDFSPPVVDLAASGFPLVGGRLDYLNGRQAAALVYQRGQHTINVFVLPADGGTPSSTDSADSVRGFHVRRWTRDGMAFWAVSDVNDADLAEFARLLRGS